jgi:hypothetical protein
MTSLVIQPLRKRETFQTSLEYRKFQGEAEPDNEVLLVIVFRDGLGRKYTGTVAQVFERKKYSIFPGQLAQSASSDL